MKKIFSIVLAGLIIASSVHLTIATHYCGGSFEAFRLSVSQEKAGCGMELRHPACEKGKSIGHNCCTDKLASYLINDSYSPASFHFVKTVSADFAILFGITNYTALQIPVSDLQITHSPPGECMASRVELASICIFRI
jgi:hypothetical protein